MGSKELLCVVQKTFCRLLIAFIRIVSSWSLWDWERGKRVWRVMLYQHCWQTSDSEKKEPSIWITSTKAEKRCLWEMWEVQGGSYDHMLIIIHAVSLQIIDAVMDTELYSAWALKMPALTLKWCVVKSFTVPNILYLSHLPLLPRPWVSIRTINSNIKVLAELWKIVGNSGFVETEWVAYPPKIYNSVEQADKKKAIEEHAQKQIFLITDIIHIFNDQRMCAKHISQYDRQG